MVTRQDLIDKIVLVSCRYLHQNGKLAEQSVTHGVVVSIDDEAVKYRTDDGAIYSLPPDLSAFTPAEPADYKIDRTGEIVRPDYLSTWTIRLPE